MGFLKTGLQDSQMRAPCGNQPSPNSLWRTGAACLVLTLFGGSLIVWADTPSQLHKANVSTCYCRCPESHRHAFCVKMCDSPRYAASHPWATRCVKARLSRPVEEHDAGPRYPHPGRAERAQASESSSSQRSN
jgi:hypothetical protein